MARIKPQQNAAMATLLSSSSQPHPAGAMPTGCVPGSMPGYSPMPMAAPGVPLGLLPSGERRLSDPDGRFRRGGSCELGGGEPPGGQARVRELRRGDWVVIRSANKSTDPELLGHDAWVARVEHNGWVELQVPKLGRTVKLQQRYLQLIQPQHPMLMMGGPLPPTPMLGPQPAATGTAIGAATGMPQQPVPLTAVGAMPLQPPSQPGVMGMPGGVARRTTSEAGAAGAGGGMAPPGMTYLDEQGRPYKRLQMDPAVRPALQPEALPPARVAATPGRGNISRVKEVLRAIRRDLLAVEESVPWNCVSATWKNVRPGWRRSLQRNIDASPTPQGQPLPAAATAVAGPAAAPAAAPPQSAAAATAADDAAAAAAAALVGATAASMSELHDALTTEKGYGLFARRGAWEARLRELADGGNNHACLQVLWAEMAEGIRVWMAAGGPPPGTPGAAPSEAYGGQTPREMYATPFPPSEDYCYTGGAPAPPPGAPHAHAATMAPSPFFDYASGGGRGGGAAAVAATAQPLAPGLVRAPMGPVPGVAPWVVRSDLALLMHAVESEVDTDLDEGPEATDVEEDSDAELAACRRRRRQPQQQQPQPAEPAQPVAATDGAASADAGAPPPAAAGPPEASAQSPGGGNEATGAGTPVAVSVSGTSAAVGPEAMDVDPGPGPAAVAAVNGHAGASPGVEAAGAGGEGTCSSGGDGEAGKQAVLPPPAMQADPVAGASGQPASNGDMPAAATPSGTIDAACELAREPSAGPATGVVESAGAVDGGRSLAVGLAAQEDTPMAD